MRIKRVDEYISEAGCDSLTLIDKVEIDNNDTLIFCSGFEDRATYLFDKVIKNKLSPRFIHISYLPIISTNKDNYIKEQTKANQLKLNDVIYDRHSPAGIFEDVKSKIKNTTGVVWVDISGMTRLLIIQLITGFMKEQKLFEKIKLLYVEAEHYPPSKEETDKSLHNYKQSDKSELISFLSSGVFEVAAVPELTSKSSDGNQSLLILFPSFNPKQKLAAEENYPPAKVIYIHGVPPDSNLIWRKEAIATLNNLENSAEENFDTSTLNYEETFKLLLHLYQEHSPFYNIVISPTGSKMQAVAVAIIRGFLSDIQIIYPTHREFENPQKYTHGVKSIYVLNLQGYHELSKVLKKECKRGYQ